MVNGIHPGPVIAVTKVWLPTFPTLKLRPGLQNRIGRPAQGQRCQPTNGFCTRTWHECGMTTYAQRRI